MSVENFAAQVSQVTRHIAGRPLDSGLEAELNRVFPANGEAFRGIFDACREAILAGWMCRHQGGGIRYGRVIKPGPGTHGFSVDVVDMADVKGPHHRHPNGEIDMIMPVDGDARFDGCAAGWRVYPPDSAHFPTVGGGRALILYLLPGGAIEFTAT